MTLGLACLTMIFLVGSVAAHAQASARYSAQYSACSDEAMTQFAMDVCASDEAARAEKERSGAYQQLLVEVASQPDALRQIKVVERAWETYRDACIEALCPAANKLAECGSIYPMEAALARADLTRLHTRALQDLLDHYRPR